MKTRRAVYPGSFDPITMGHVDIIERASHIFGEVIVLVSEAHRKSHAFTVEERIELVRKCCAKFKNVKVDAFAGLTVQYAKKNEAQFIVRGLRSGTDFEYEMSMSMINKRLEPEVETVILLAHAEHSAISSSFIKEIAANGGSLEGFVPQPILKTVEKKLIK